MLRITAKESAGKRVQLILEGRLVGPWVQVLEAAIMKTRSESTGAHLDLSSLHFADAEGLGLLHRLVADGIILENVSPFMQELMAVHRG